jgi:hypothetical protein
MLFKQLSCVFLDQGANRVIDVARARRTPRAEESAQLRQFDLTVVREEDNALFDRPVRARDPAFVLLPVGVERRHDVGARRAIVPFASFAAIALPRVVLIPSQRPESTGFEIHALACPHVLLCAAHQQLAQDEELGALSLKSCIAARHRLGTVHMPRVSVRASMQGMSRR